MTDFEDSFQTILENAEGIFKDKGSKFLAFAFPVTTEKEISEIQKTLKKKYYDARHHAYAFRLGADKKNFRASDDGEPSNSSGAPILGQIRSFDLTDILIVVVRYFGGTKLGIPGLINAYKSAAVEAIIQSKIIHKTVNQNLTAKCSYSLLNEIMKIVKDDDLEILNQSFDTDCTVTLSIRLSKFRKIEEKLRNIHGIELL